MPAFITRRKVEFAQTDMAGIVHFANYYRWMEEAEHDFFRSHGLKVMERQPDGTAYIGWPRVSCSCQYEAPAHYEDELELHVRVERVGFKSVTFFHEIHTGGRRIANGRMKIACCLCRSDGMLTAIEIPEVYRNAFESVAEPTLTGGGKTK